MATYRNALPQLSRKLFLTGSGIESTLIFHEGLELPDFAAFSLLKEHDGTEALQTYFPHLCRPCPNYNVGLSMKALLGALNLTGVRNVAIPQRNWQR